MSIPKVRKALRRDFFLDLSEGFIYDCLHRQVRQLEMAEYRRWVLEHFRGTLCVDELHLGRYTLLLATDPCLPEESGGETRAHEQSRGTGEPQAALLRESPLQVASPPHDRPVPAAGHRPLVARTPPLRKAASPRAAESQSPSSRSQVPAISP